MNRLLTILFALFAFSTLATAQDSGYDIKIKIDGFEEDEMYLGYFYADKQYLRDTTTRDENGWFRFQGEEAYEGGVYLIVMPPDNKFFQLILDKDEQHFTIETKMPDMAGNLKLKNAPDNQLLYDYLAFLSSKRPASEKLGKELKAAQDAGNEADAQKVREKLEDLNDEVSDYQKKLVEKHPKSLTAAIVKANMPLQEPKYEGKDDMEIQRNRWRWNQEHYFDNLNLGDPRLLRSPFLFQKVNDYVDKMVVQHPDTISIAVDRVLNLMRPAPETFKYYLIHFLNKYAGSKIVGMDAVYVHIVDNYYAKGAAPWTEEEQLAKIIDNANKLRPILIGQTAPNIKMQTRDKKEINLYDVKTPYTVLLVWDPDCGHCKKSMPDIKKFYEEYKDKGVEIFAICNKSWTRDDDGNISFKEVEKCWEYIDDNEIGTWVNVVDPMHRSQYKKLYFIQSTPQIFILDKDKKIVLKRIEGSQLSEVMDKIIEGEQEKWEEEGR
ncbi:MAG: redoxin domain-containing protein [Bacteroidota bacterium]